MVKALAQCGAEVIAFSRTQADLDSLKQEVSYCFKFFRVMGNSMSFQSSNVGILDCRPIALT